MHRDPTLWRRGQEQWVVHGRPLLLLLVVGAAVTSSVAPDATGADTSRVNCIACDMPLGADRVEVRHRGRRVHLHDGGCLTRWDEDRDTIFSRLQARGALFDESAMPSAAMSYAWLCLGLYILVGLLCGAACAYVAISRGHPAVGWFAAGLALNVPALLLALTRPRVSTSTLPDGIPPGLRKVPVTHAPAPCPECTAMNHPAADHCTGCGAALQPTAATEVGRA